MEMVWYIPILIYFARICDVTIGTIRIIFVIRGRTTIAALLGFVEVSIWVLAIAGTLKYLTANPLALISYAAGFATGNIVGIKLEKLLVTRYQTVRAVNPDPQVNLSDELRSKGYPVTYIDGMGKDGNVEICSITLLRGEVAKLESDILELSPNVFITTSEVMDAYGGVRSQLFSKTPAWLKVRKD